ncbi:unnamed protein product [Rotaria sordida]|uniref:Uncharacterized protein n=2 Tax=Rotaria sordida TaxID=392033 RepID=A0A815HE08_9BILA|nr:unnamed protein product [Rotaria sordida]CAF1352872.1 unnamed protein product [Rotaria sordida]
MLLPINYPQLHSLSLVNFKQKILLQYLTGDTIVCSLLTNQIKHLDVEIKDDITREFSDENESNMFELILSLGKCLVNLTFSEWFSGKSLHISTLNITSTGCVSSSLTKLKIEVNTFDDCLYLLDGRLQCLSTLIIKIFEICYSLANIDNKKTLPKLKCFSLTSECYTQFYNDGIVLLLRRMLNLEELTLFLLVSKIESTYIDGIQLYDEILIFMRRLNKLTFSINTLVFNRYITVDLPSNDDIQNSFIKRRYQPVGSYADEKLTDYAGRCHVYSLPYQFDCFYHLTNCFQGGIFNKVRWLAMADQHPFEHELFEKISHDFPFLQKLVVLNSKPQKNKQHASTLITFVHLVELNLRLAHTNYVEQFLLETKTCLPHLKNLVIEYESLAMITNNFTNDATHRNCSQLRRIDIDKPFICPENFHSYFPLL